MNSRTNLMAAEKMGWKVLWFDDYNPTESVNRVHSALEPEAEHLTQFNLKNNSKNSPKFNLKHNLNQIVLFTNKLTVLLF